MAKVLVADDEPDFLTAITIRLKAAGHEVQCVEDGQALLEACAENKPDVIVLDVMMPNLDGFAACRQLKSDDATKDIPTIFLTAGAFDLSEAIDDLAPAEDFLLKTVDGSAIVERIAELLKS